MLRRTWLYAAVAALVVAFSVVVINPALSAAAPIRIMPLGDSITAGPGCWRAMLWNKVQTTGYTNIDFVGGVAGGGCNYGYTYDIDHEGHGGYAATGIADNNQLPPWLAAASPDVVIMHLGTNDMWGGWIPTDRKITAFTKLVGQMRAQNPNMKIVVAQIIPMSAGACATCPADVIALNQLIPGWAAGLSTAQSPIYVADLWTGFNTATDTGDGVHPNDAGFRKMADAWYPTLIKALGGVTPSPTRTSSSPTPTATPTASPTSTPSPTSNPAGCGASFKVASQWGGAFQGEVTVKNNRTTASSAWTATITFANGQQVTQVWNATVVQSGATATARNVSYNGTIAAGASTSFGFLASWNNTANNATVTCSLS